MSTAHRLAAAASLVLTVPLLSACGGGSTVQQAASAVQSAASQAASAASSAASAAASESPTPADSSTPATDTSTPAAAAGSLCDAVGELKNMSDKPSSKDVDTLRQAAADIKANAPAQVAKGAASYAVILEALAASLESKATGANAGMAAAIAQGMSKDPKDITAFITYVATTCK